MNPSQAYKAHYLANLPAGVSYDPKTASFFYNDRRFKSITMVESYRRKIENIETTIG